MELSELKTPCYIFDLNEFKRGVTSFHNALSIKLNDITIAYSVKTNSLPEALRQAKMLSCKAEVVSHDEYCLAKACGFAPKDIIYNGPMKSRETFIEAVTAGAIVNIETHRELEWLEQAAKSSGSLKVGIRLNINISHISLEDADSDNDNSRFGFATDTAEFENAINTIASLDNVTLAGLHLHRTTHSRTPRFYARLVDYAASVISKYSLDLEYLDLGGGYYGIFHNKPTFTDYTNAIYQSLKKNNLTDIAIIIEPGNALTASSFSFISEIIDTKQVEDNLMFATCDGSRNDIDPFFRKTDYIKTIKRTDDNRPTRQWQTIGGCTCLEYDRLFTLKNETALAVGDRIIFHNVGAYTMTLTPQFIRLWPRVYMKTDDKYTLIRNASTINDIIAGDISINKTTTHYE